jgi:hypothetical protein
MFLVKKQGMWYGAVANKGKTPASPKVTSCKKKRKTWEAISLLPLPQKKNTALPSLLPCK